MHCTRCGNEMVQQERFCSKCGQDSTAVRIPPPVQAQARPRDWDTHVKVVAWIFIVGAVFAATPGMVLLIARLNVNGMPVYPPIFPMRAMLGFMSGMFLLVPAGIAAAGIGLLKYRE